MLKIRTLVLFVTFPILMLDEIKIIDEIRIYIFKKFIISTYAAFLWCMSTMIIAVTENRDLQSYPYWFISGVAILFKY